jgi:redox-sensitive bicupin YhaK (pirin superfamily)
MKRVVDIRRNVPAHWVGDGFPVRSLFTYQEPEAFDPFLLLDYAGPYEFAPAEATRGVGEHPHRGFETVTIVYQGELEHRDSSGGRGAIGPGDVQWMTAASGLVHEEFHSDRFTRDGGVLEMVQLWVNLPARDKRSAPKYQTITADQIPVVELPDDAGSARVIAGEFRGVRGPAQTFTPVAAWDLRLKAGGRTTMAVPEGQTALAVVQRGRVKVNDADLAEAVALVRFDRAGADFTLEALDDAMVLVLTGQPLGEPVVGQGPFVMNTRDEIRTAIADFQAGKMGRLAAAR